MEFVYPDMVRPPIKIKYPKDFEKWINRAMPTAIIYNRWKKKAACIHCGAVWDYTKEFDIHADDRVVCPCCGMEQVARPHTSEAHAWKSFFWMWNEKGGINFAVMAAWWHYEKQPIGEFSLPLTVSLETCGRISKTEKDCYSYWNYLAKWTSSSICIDSVYDYPEHYPGNRTVLKRSFIKHCESFISDSYGATDQIKLIDFYSKHPQAEYLFKAGLGQLIESSIWGYPLYIRPNWKAKTIPGVLRLSPQDVDKLKAWGMLRVDDIAVYHLIKKYKKNPTKEDVELISNCDLEIKDLNELMVPGTSPMRFIKYIYKQAKIWEKRNKVDEANRPMCHAGYYYYQPQSPEYYVRGMYRDYIDIIDKLNYPKDDYYIYPKDLSVAHDAAVEEYNRIQKKEEAKRNRELNEEFKRKILPEVERFAFKDDVFLIRPLRSKQDFVAEGKNNHNCVATYWDRALKGTSRIFVLRKSETPNISYVTIELTPDNKLKQCLETGNRLPSDDVKAWVDKWLECVVRGKIRNAAEGAADMGGQMLCQTA